MNSSEEEQIYSIALTMVPGIGHIGAKHLMDEAATPTAAWTARSI